MRTFVKHLTLGQSRLGCAWVKSQLPVGPNSHGHIHRLFLLCHQEHPLSLDHEGTACLCIVRGCVLGHYCSVCRPANFIANDTRHGWHRCRFCLNSLVYVLSLLISISLLLLHVFYFFLFFLLALQCFPTSDNFCTKISNKIKSRSSRRREQGRCSASHVSVTVVLSFLFSLSL